MKNRRHELRNMTIYGHNRWRQKRFNHETLKHSRHSLDFVEMSHTESAQIAEALTHRTTYTGLSLKPVQRVQLQLHLCTRQF